MTIDDWKTSFSKFFQSSIVNRHSSINLWADVYCASYWFKGGVMGEDASFPILETYNVGPAVIAGTYALEEKAVLLSSNDNVAVARQDLDRKSTRRNSSRGNI